MPNPLPVIVQGLGPIGRKIAQAAQRDAGLDVVAASGDIQQERAPAERRHRHHRNHPPTNASDCHLA